MSPSTLSNLSYNICRSPTIWTRLSNHPLLRTLDILLLQEPPAALAAPPGWVLLPPPPGEERARCAAHVRAKWDPTTYSQVAVSSFDVLALDLHAGNSSVRILGVYNPHQGGPHPGRAAREALASAPLDSLVIVAGDFNLHHPEWDPEHPGEVCEDAEEAKLTFDRAGLVHLLPPGTLAYRGGSSTTASRPSTLFLATCARRRAAFTPRRLFRRAEPAALLTAIEPRLPPAPATPMTAADVDQHQ
ncbi:hypothetical protein JCM10449v2_003392 [Rhodotorula kratochvilovae]